MDIEAVADRLVAAREAVGMKQRTAASRLGVDYSTLSGYERAKRPPSLRHLMVLADLYGVSERWLLRGDEKPLEEDERFDPVALSILREMPHEVQRALTGRWWELLNKLYWDMKLLEGELEVTGGTTGR